MAEIFPLGTTLAWAKAWRRPSTWVVAIISLGFLAWVLWRANLSDVWHFIRAADYKLIGICLPVIFFGLMFRTFRWGILLVPLGKAPFWASFRSLTVGYLGNNVLPARGGELVRAYALGRQVDVSISSILATIIVERMSDALVISLGLVCFFFAFPAVLPAYMFQVTAAGIIVISGIMLGMVAIRRVQDWTVNLVRSLCSTLPERWQGKCISLVEDFLRGLRSFRSWTDALLYSLVTIAVWAVDVLVFWLAGKAFGLSLTVPAVALVVAIGALSTMIPALPGYVGTYQFALVHVLTLLGVLIGPATAYAFGIHGLIWLTANAIGTVCALQLGLKLTQPYDRVV